MSIQKVIVADGLFPSVVDVFRLAKKVPNKARPMKVGFESSSEVDTILKKCA
jgi:hypothetical protein